MCALSKIMTVRVGCVKGSRQLEYEILHPSMEPIANLSLLHIRSFFRFMRTLSFLCSIVLSPTLVLFGEKLLGMVKERWC